MEHWNGGQAVTTPQPLRLSALPVPLRWEIAFGIQRAREVDSPPRMSFGTLRRTIAVLAGLPIRSLLEPEEANWPQSPRRRNYRPAPPEGPSKLRQEFLIFVIDELDRLAGRVDGDHEYARDIWRLRRIGVTGPARGWLFDFTAIDQAWLREAIKRFLRWRNDTGHSPSGMHRDLITLTRLARALTDTAGPEASPAQFTRPILNRLLTVLAEDGLTLSGRNMALSSVSRFLAIARQHDWLDGVPARTVLYSEDFPARTPLLPRALPEFVMAQLEDPANLDLLTDPRWRLLFPLLMQTGLRVNDALHLPQDCLVHDHQQAPYLRYYNHKMKREALVPISDELAAAIGVQVAYVRERYSTQAILFPRATNNHDGTQVISGPVVSTKLNQWIGDCGIRDERGEPVRVTAHQFRHTLGTRLINNDVPQEVVRKILDHTSTEMTAHYARLHDTTVRDHWERARKVDIHGHTVPIADDSPLADAAWTKHHLARATMALPNGYCGLPLQQSCPHSNACLTCAVFITTPEFLPQHRQQLELTRGIIERARQRGQLRLIEMNTRTADNLTAIITSLEREPDDTDPQASS
ncbi:tyrosine-type recombinase/integrase [Rhodococcus pyridinivorans]|uniref:tyrosine-type recombinase/integrase n=1 Tax=Rhodococcus pyridinivorans TaxID=103816 RepID=UPI0039B5C69E